MPRRPKISPQAALATEKQRQALELRCLGLTYEQIAEKVGYKGISSVQSALQAAIKKALAEPMEELRAVDGAKLDFIWKRMLDRVAEDPSDYKAYEIMLKVLTRRAALFGLDAPVRREISGPDGGPIEIAPWRDGDLMAASADPEVARHLDEVAVLIGRRKAERPAIEIAAEEVKTEAGDE